MKKIDSTRIKELYELGFSGKKISDLLTISPTHVYRHLKKLGFPPKNKKRKTTRTLSPEEREELKDVTAYLFSKKWTRLQIAEVLDISSVTVRNYLLARGLTGKKYSVSAPEEKNSNKIRDYDKQSDK